MSISSENPTPGTPVHRPGNNGQNGAPDPIPTQALAKFPTNSPTPRIPVDATRPPGYNSYNSLPTPVNDAPAGQEPSLLEYWRIIRRRKGALIIAATLGLIAGILVTLPQTPIYQAKTTIEIQDMNQDFLGMRQVQQVSDLPSTTVTDIQTQIRILQSESLKDRVAKKITDLQKNGDVNAKPIDTRESAWRKVLGLKKSADNPETELEESLKYIDKNLKARAAGQTRLIEVLIDSSDPKFAATYANTLTNEFIEQNLEARWNSTQRTSAWLTKQLEELKIKLEHSEDALQAYARQSGLLYTGTNDKERTSVSEDKLKQLQQALSNASTDRITKQSRYELAKSAPEDSLPDVLNDNALRDYQSKLTEIQRQISDLSTIYSPEYKKVRQLKAQEKILQNALVEARGAILQRITNDYQESVRREKMLEQDYLSQTGVVTNQNEKSIQYSILKREVDTNRQIYEALLQKVKESSIAAAMKASNVRIVDPAKSPLLPYKPSIPINTAIGLLTGLFLGLSFIVMQERANKTFQEPGEAKDYLGIPELGVIPNAFASRTKDATKIAKRIGARVTPDKAVELVTWQNKPSIQAEAFRATLMSILFTNSAGRMPRCLAVTSPGPGEGKTTTACNLAIAIAELNTKVLLIDGDLRKPRVHNIFKLDNGPGFAGLLKNPTVRSYEALAAVQPSGVVPNLDILTAGQGSMASTTFLYTQQLQKLLDMYMEHYDTILIDTPPMLQIPDARVIGRHVEGTVLVFRSNKTTKEAGRAAQYRLREDGLNLFGILINDWNPKHSGSGYYGYYYKSYYANYHGDKALAAASGEES